MFLAGLLLALSSFAYGKESLCDALNLPDCTSVNKVLRRSSAKSLPSTGSSYQFNPANVSHDRGFGVEAFYQPSNPVTLSLVTGTGRTGAALVTSGNENGFFGNRLIELEENFLDRNIDQKQFKSKKYSAAVGVALLKRKHISLDIGLSGRYNQDVKKVNPGGGASLRIGPFSAGASVYQDDVFLEFKGAVNPRTGTSYSIEQGSETYSEKFQVQTYFVGLKLWNLFLDAGTLKTHYKFYDDDVNIQIYSAAFIWKKFLFNYAIRNEVSPSWKFKEDELVDEREQKSSYMGVQYSVNKFLVLGIHHNYYLLNETSVSSALFF